MLLKDVEYPAGKHALLNQPSIACWGSFKIFQKLRLNLIHIMNNTKLDMKSKIKILIYLRKKKFKIQLKFKNINYILLLCMKLDENMISPLLQTTKQMGERRLQIILV